MSKRTDKHFSRREFLRIGGYAGLGLSSLSMWSCGGSAGSANKTSSNGSSNSNPTPNPTPTPTPQPITDTGYKALVNVFLFGGNDGYNLLVPTTQAKYDSYSAARLNLAIPQNQLLALNGLADDGAAYGLHPSCTDMQTLFNSGKAAMMANVGSLTFPTTRADYLANRVPPRLFSHNDQQDQWQTAHADISDPTGWAGRIADVLSASANGSSELPLNVSIAGANLMQRGASTNAFSLSSSGAQQLSQLTATGKAPDLRAAFDRIRALNEAHVFERGYSDTLDRGIRVNALIDSALKAAPALSTAFPANNSLAAQLQTVARLINIRAAMGAKRQIFFVSLGGFDTHDAQLTDQPVLLQKLSQALQAFYNATNELGLADRVTTFTSSDFGRTLTTNGKGTDHGWSNHHVLVGGAVRGGRIYGMPPSLVPGSSDDTQGGRFIPSTAVDQYGATLAQWMGVSDSNLSKVFPNIGRFASRDLGFML
jgi:uncharacterized protein (DUF1501 family)